MKRKATTEPERLALPESSVLRALLSGNEGKTLEFKENLSSPHNIVRTVVAFANTAGGTLVIGVRDRSREIVGVRDVLAEEERLSNLLADNIRPRLIPDIQVQSYRDRELLLITVPHTAGPYFVAAEGPESGVYVRLGSSNRRAGPELTAEIERLVRNVFFDEEPCPDLNSEAIDFRAASELFSGLGKKLGEPQRRSLGLIVGHQGREVPTQGAVLLFGRDRLTRFPDAVVRCARFADATRTRFIDQTEIDEHLPSALASAVKFVERHTNQGITISRLRHEAVPQYPVAVVREAITNALVHADYALRGSGVRIAVFDDRIEITNPGFLPFGLTLEAALSGVSQLRNRVIGRVFRSLGLIEQWGSGISRMIAECRQFGIRPPKFEEIAAHFRVTLYHGRAGEISLPDWHTRLTKHLREHGGISTRDAARFWSTSSRTARSRLRKLAQAGILAEIGTGPRDPYRKYALRAGAEPVTQGTADERE